MIAAKDSLALVLTYQNYLLYGNIDKINLIHLPR